MRVFFYGLFMDDRLLAEQGVRSSDARQGFLEGYRLRIGSRATLVRQAGYRAYGVVMTVTRDDASALYADDSVADYVPETVTVRQQDGTQVEATCYNLPVDKITGTNRHYAGTLLGVATRLGFPDNYLDEIRQAAAALGR